MSIDRRSRKSREGLRQEAEDLAGKAENHKKRVEQATHDEIRFADGMEELATGRDRRIDSTAAEEMENALGKAREVAEEVTEESRGEAVKHGEQMDDVGETIGAGATQAGQDAKTIRDMGDELHDGTGRITGEITEAQDAAERSQGELDEIGRGLHDSRDDLTRKLDEEKTKAEQARTRRYEL